MHPTARLLNWWQVNPDTVFGAFKDHPVFEDGIYYTVHNIIEVRVYKDHKIFVTQGGEFYIAYKIDRHLNGG